MALTRVSLAAVLLCLVRLGGDEPPTSKALAELQGEWKVVEIKYTDGIEPEGDPNKWRILVKGDTFRVDPDGKTSGENFKFKLNPTKMPREIDAAMPEDARLPGLLRGAPFFGIYALENERLRLCVRFFGDRPKEFVCPKEFGLLLTLKRHTQ